MVKKLLRSVAFALIIAFAAASGGCAPRWNTALGYYFDTFVSLQGRCKESVLQEALQECARYEALLSKNRQGSVEPCPGGKGGCKRGNAGHFRNGPGHCPR